MRFAILEKERGAKMAVAALNDELLDIDGVCGRGFDSIRSGGYSYSDRMTMLVIRKDKIRVLLMKAIEDYLSIVNQAEKELETVDDAELKALLHWRYRCNLSWPEIAEKSECKMSTDAVKKRFKRLLDEYEASHHAA